MRKSKFKQLENRFFVLQKAEESIDIQNYDEESGSVTNSVSQT